MGLRELKKEAEQLPAISELISKFQQHWIRHLKSNTNVHLPSLQKISSETKKQINNELSSMKKCLKLMERGQLINEKLRKYTSHLIDLKLTTLNGNAQKFWWIINVLLQDDFFSIPQTIAEIKDFELAAERFNTSYEMITEILCRILPLDESLQFIDQPHKNYFVTIQKLGSRQKRILQEFGDIFFVLVRGTKFKR